jgi:hypothetical protein
VNVKGGMTNRTCEQGKGGKDNVKRGKKVRKM